MPMRRMIIPENRKHPFDLHARGIHRYQDHALLGVLGGAGIGLAHHDRDGAPRVAHARAPPFPPVDHIMIAVARHAGLDVGRIRARHRRLGHQKGRADIALHQRREPPILLRPRAVAVEDFHIAGVRGRAVEALGRPAEPPHLLGTKRIFQVGQLRAAKLEAVVDMGLARMRRHEEVPQTRSLGLGLHFLDHRQHLPAIALLLLGAILAVAGPDARVDERLHPVAEIGLALAQREIHGASSPISVSKTGVEHTGYSVKSGRRENRHNGDSKKRFGFTPNPLDWLQ